MRLLLLCAPAFSGKTSLSLALEARGWLRISTDVILRDRGFEPGKGLPVELWQEASLTACSLITAAAQKGQDVVLDDTLCFRFLRDRYREVGIKADMSVALVVLMISAAEVRARVRLNRGSKLREDIEDDLLETHLASFEWPSADEPHLQLDAGQSVDQQLRLLDASS